MRSTASQRAQRQRLARGVARFIAPKKLILAARSALVKPATDWRPGVIESGLETAVGPALRRRRSHVAFWALLTAGQVNREVANAEDRGILDWLRRES